MFAKRSNLQVAHISLSLKKKILKKQKPKKTFPEQKHGSKRFCALSHFAEYAACLDKKKHKCLKVAHSKGRGIGKFWQGKGSTNVP